MPKRSTTNRKDGAETYLRILTAAGKLFAEQGFASTTNKAVAQHAQVDLASINYHFGNRSGFNIGPFSIRNQLKKVYKV